MSSFPMAKRKEGLREGGGRGCGEMWTVGPPAGQLPNRTLHLIKSPETPGSRMASGQNKDLPKTCESV